MIKLLFTFIVFMLITYTSINANATDNIVEEEKNSQYTIYRHGKVLYNNVINVQYDSTSKEYMFLVYDNTLKIYIHAFENAHDIHIINNNKFFWKK